MNPKTITLDDIAKQLNVSRVTVSKALRGHPDISAQTTETIKNLAKELGYAPNYMARNLSSKKSHSLGLVVPKIAHFFFSQLIESVYDTAFENKYEIILTVSQENSERELKHIQTLLSMRVDGILVSISQNTHDPLVFENVKKMGIPLIFIDRVLDIPGFSSVTVDDSGGAFKAVEHAINIGYTKIGTIAGYDDINIGRLRYLGFEKAMKKHNLPVNPQWVVRGGLGEEDGYNGFMKIYKDGNLPEFIFAVTYPVALGIYSAAKELGLKVPNDIDVISFGKSDINEFIYPSLSYISQPPREIGRAGVELLLETIKNPTAKEKHVKVNTELILQETCLSKNKQLVKD